MSCYIDEINTFYLNLTFQGEEGTSLAESLRATAEAALSQTGFAYDENTGMYYDHSTGFYYDSVCPSFYISFAVMQQCLYRAPSAEQLV